MFTFHFHLINFAFVWLDLRTKKNSQFTQKVLINFVGVFHSRESLPINYITNDLKNKEHQDSQLCVSLRLKPQVPLICFNNTILSVKGSGKIMLLLIQIAQYSEGFFLWNGEQCQVPWINQ